MLQISNYCHSSYKATVNVSLSIPLLDDTSFKQKQIFKSVVSESLSKIVQLYLANFI